MASAAAATTAHAIPPAYAASAPNASELLDLQSLSGLFAATSMFSGLKLKVCGHQTVTLIPGERANTQLCVASEWARAAVQERANCVTATNDMVQVAKFGATLKKLD